jgi:hypothetical protein
VTGWHGWHPAISAAAEGTSALANWVPSDGTDLLGFMTGLPEGYFGVKAANFARLAKRIGGDFPVDPMFADVMAELAQTEQRASDAAAEAVHVFWKLHEREIRRITDPRPGEYMWNV